MERSSELYDNIYKHVSAKHVPTKHVSTGAAELPFIYTAAESLNEYSDDQMEHSRWHEQIEIKLMLRGRAEIICGPKLFLTEEGDIIVINSRFPAATGKNGTDQKKARKSK